MGGHEYCGASCVGLRPHLTNALNALMLHLLFIFICDVSGFFYLCCRRYLLILQIRQQGDVNLAVV
jgi:hypothetical protein